MSTEEEEHYIQSWGTTYSVRNLSYFKFSDNVSNWCFWSCFPHIVNLCCEAVLGAITNKFATENADDYERSGDAPWNFDETLKQDSIATTHSLIRGVQICLSPSSECDYILSIHRSNHHLFIINIFQIYSKLLSRDTYNCCKMWTHDGPQPFGWSRGHFFCVRFLTLISVHSFHELTSCLQAIDQFFKDYVEQCRKNGAYFPELTKFKLAEWEWSALQIFREILWVCTLIITRCSIND